MPRWTTFESKDKMTGELSAYATSPVTTPIPQMSFPYQDVKAWLDVGYDGDSEWVYIRFNTSPNLTNTITSYGYYGYTSYGYDQIKTRLKWDDEIEYVELTQKWGDNALHFENDHSAILRIKKSKTLLLELQWHGEQSTYFEFTLNGSSKALNKIKATF
jgi:hypothetical protein